MKLLLDQHLSRKLVPPLESAFPGVSHVIAHQLDRCDDETVWSFAKGHSYTIVTKDQDYQAFSFMWGHPPKVIWIRSGNGPTRIVLDVLLRSRSVIEAFEADDERSLLVLP